MDVAHAATAWLNGTVARPPQPHMHKAIALSRLREPIASNRATVPGCIRARRIQPRRHARRPGRARPPAACSAGHSRRRPPTMATRPLRRSHSTSIRSVDCPPRPWCPLAAVTPHLAPPPTRTERAGAAGAASRDDEACAGAACVRAIRSFLIVSLSMLFGNNKIISSVSSS